MLYAVGRTSDLSLRTTAHQASHCKACRQLLGQCSGRLCQAFCWQLGSPSHQAHQTWSSGIFDHWVCQHPLRMMAQSPLTSPAFVKASGKHHEVWQGLHVFPRSASSKGAKLCTYHRWFARIGPVSEPHYSLPLSNRAYSGAYAVCFTLDLMPTICRLKWPAPAFGLCSPLGLGMHVRNERHNAFIAIHLMTIACAIPGFLMAFMGQCSFSYGIPIRRMVHPACCRCWIELISF